MTVGVFSGIMYRNSALSHDYGIRILAGTRCKTPLRDFNKLEFLGWSFVLKTGTIEERKTQILFKLRGYKLIKREEQEDIISLLARIPKERKRVLVWCIVGKRVVGVAYVNKLEKAMKAAEAERGIIVANCRYTFAAKRNSRKYGIELIPKTFPSFNIFKHELVPKHEILPPEEAKELLDKYRAKVYQLPQIKASDIVAIAIGAKPGDILKITRKSVTAGKYSSYRYVTLGWQVQQTLAIKPEPVDCEVVWCVCTVENISKQVNKNKEERRENEFEF